MSKTVHQLKITLRGVKPPVWRRIVVESDVSLEDLAPMIEAAMGWYGGHLHMFDVDGTIYDRHHPVYESIGLDEKRYRLSNILPSVGSKMGFDYDFGDGWEHNVVVEEINPIDVDITYPYCSAGKRACPPEDCGGPWGYANLLEATADPEHPDHEMLSEWLPHDFNPSHFNPDEATADMRSARPLEF